MPRKQTFMLVSLEEDKAKRLAQVLSNDTSRRILDALAEGKKTLSQLSKDLTVPLPTMHYNIKALQEAGLVTSKEFNYSAKGREMQHYELVNKYVIIAPAAAKEGIKEKLKAILPALATVGVVGLAYQFLKSGFVKTMQAGAPAVEKAAQEATRLSVAAPSAAPFMEKEAAGRMAEGVAETAASAPPDIISTLSTQAQQLSPLLYLFVGAVAAILLYLFFDYVWKKMQK
ncbi:winged helix-turn-helix transcriptional regulator [Candidatus Woesearchaeota archaeon]|nr:winged helix-turn-helix transcriptional regulator [Candidatus Woesearchaeota archaeon]